MSQTTDEIPWDDDDSGEVSRPRADEPPGEAEPVTIAVPSPAEPPDGDGSDGPTAEVIRLPGTVQEPPAETQPPATRIRLAEPKPADEDVAWDETPSPAAEPVTPSAEPETAAETAEPETAEPAAGETSESATAPEPAPEEAPEPVAYESFLPQRSAPPDAGFAVAATADDEIDADFFEDDDEPFDHPDVQKMGIIGGKGVGKSYLFQAMVYRTLAGTHSGAMTYYLESDAIRLFTALRRKDRASTVNLARFTKNYSSWRRLPTTKLIDQKWYRLRLPYRTGLLGRGRSAIDVEFFDGSGEGFFEAVRDADNRRLWRDGYLDAKIMVFCLPLWVAFPDRRLSPDDWRHRDMVLEGFEQVLQNYLDLRSLNQRDHPVCSILALTMADDRRSALKTLRDRWISPYIDSAPSYLQRLRRGSGVARYLANARKVSDALHEEFAHSRDPLVASIPQKLDFNGGRPWLIPVSAIEGSLLETVESKYKGTAEPPRLPPPVPVHVELPLLVALCERDNALM